VKIKGEMDEFDCIVIGLGAHGSASVHEISQAGAKVLGIEAYPRSSHEHGSSHGRSRIIRYGGSSFYDISVFVFACV